MKTRNIKELLLFSFLILFMYAGFYILTLLFLTSYDAKGLVIGNIYIFTPLVILISTTWYAFKDGFSFPTIGLVCTLYPITFFTFRGWYWEFFLYYAICAVLGNFLGHGIRLAYTHIKSSREVKHGTNYLGRH